MDAGGGGDLRRRGRDVRLLHHAEQRRELEADEHERLGHVAGTAEEGEETEFIPKYSLGIRYQPIDLFSFGIESIGSKYGYYAGPTISHGNEEYWMAFGVLKSIGKPAEEQPEFQIRMLVGLGL